MYHPSSLTGMCCVVVMVLGGGGGGGLFVKNGTATPDYVKTFDVLVCKSMKVGAANWELMLHAVCTRDNLLYVL